MSTENAENNLGFEGEVLRQLGQIHNTIAQNTTGTFDRIDALKTDLGAKIEGVEIRLGRNDRRTSALNGRVKSLEDKVGEPSGFINLPDTDPAELVPAPEKGPLSSITITLADVKGFLKILPLIAALTGGGFAVLNGEPSPSPDDAGSISGAPEPSDSSKSKVKK